MDWEILALIFVIVVLIGNYIFEFVFKNTFYGSVYLK